MASWVRRKLRGHVCLSRRDSGQEAFICLFIRSLLRFFGVCLLNTNHVPGPPLALRPRREGRDEQAEEAERINALKGVPRAL